jgi:hypothetical protein
MPFTPKPRARLRIAGELAPIIGLSRDHIARQLKAMGDDREAVIAHYRAHGKKSWCGQPRPAAYNGRPYRSRTALAAELAATLRTGHSVRAIRHKLEQRQGDVDAVIAWCRRTPGRPKSLAVTVGGERWPSRAAYIRELSRRYGLSVSAAKQWVQKLGPEGALARAMAFARGDWPSKREQPWIALGIKKSAYYQRKARAKRRAAARDRDGTPILEAGGAG